MSAKTQKMQQKVQRIAGKVGENHYLKSISNGLISILPVMVIGALATLFGALNFEVYQNFIESLGLKDIFSYISNMTLSIVSVYAVFFIGYKFAEVKGQDGTGAIGAGLIALMSFMVLLPTINTEDISAIPFQFLGAQGLFVAIFAGLVASRVYLIFIEKNWTIKLPDGVPPTVSRTFSNLVPATVVVVSFAVISKLFTLTEFGSIFQMMYTMIQTPLQNVGGSYPAIILIVLIQQLLWFVGIHGRLVVNPIFVSVWLPLGIENLERISAGLEPTNIMHTGFYAVLIGIGGAGATLGLAILMSFVAKSKQFKTLGRLSLPASIFGINEPIIFGTPIILNPIMFIPFVFTPLILGTFAYVLISLGIFPILNGTHITVGTPIVINALLQGSAWILALQFINIALATLIYLPFFKILDKQAVEQETATEQS